MKIPEFDTLAQFLSGLSLEELGKRLNISDLTLREMSKNQDFPQWSQKQDPEGVSWKMSHENCYLPNLTFSQESQND